MIRDLGSVDGDRLDTDVCIIGSGAAGITIARDLDGVAAGDCLTVTLGDYVDRGPGSRTVLDRLSGDPFPTPFVALKGNHEALLQEFLGNPSVAEAVRTLIGMGVDRLIVLPMYPQYSATTTASATDVLFHALMKERRVPALRIVPPYYDHPAYLDALTAIIGEQLARLAWKPDHCVLSFHGILIRYAVQAAEGEAQASPPPDGETPGGYARRLVTAAVLCLVEQGLLLIPPDLEQRLAVQAEADDSTDHSRT